MMAEDFKLYRHKTFLERKCAIFSIYEIAEQCGVTYPTIMAWVKKFKINVKKCKIEESAEVKFSLDIPNYMMVHLKRRSEKIKQSMKWIVKQAIAEHFFRMGINVFRDRENKEQ